MMVTKELRVKIRACREPTANVDGKQVPGSVSFINELIAITHDPLERDALLVELAGEYLRADLDDEHLLVQRARVAYQPDAAVIWLGLAHSLGMRKDGAQEAKLAVAKGLAIARDVGTLIRYALTCQAAVARQASDPILFEKALRELIEDADNYREDDSGLDDHIIADLPEEFCSTTLILKYRSLLERQRSQE